MAAMHYEQQPLVYIRDKGDYLRSKQIPPPTLYLLDTLIQSACLPHLSAIGTFQASIIFERPLMPCF